MPRANITNEYLMALSIARALDRQGGTTIELDSNLQATEFSDDDFQCPRTTHSAFPHPPPFGVMVKSGDTSLVPATDAKIGQGSGSSLSTVCDSQILGASAISGLMLVRPTVTGAIQKERMRVTNSRDDVAKSCRTIGSRLSKELKKQKFLECKVVEKNGSHNRAAMELQRTRDMVNTAKMGNASAATK